MSKRFLLILSVLVFMFTLMLTPSMVDGQTVLKRMRIGNNAEGLTYVHTGAYARHAVILDGYEARGVPAVGVGGAAAPARKLFDLRGLDIAMGPRGMAYIESEMIFALVEPTQPTTLLTCDHQGRDQGSHTIQYLGGFVPEHLEGLAYIPETASLYPDHLALVVVNFIASEETRIEILDLSGQVVKEIIPEEPLASGFGIGLTHMAPDLLMLHDVYTALSYLLDFDGEIIGPPLAPPGDSFGEGLEQLPNGRIMGSDYWDGNLFFYDDSLERLPELDRSYLIEPGVTSPLHIAWDETDEQFLVYQGRSDQLVVAMPESLDAADTLVDLEAQGLFAARGLAYLPGEDLIAMVDRSSQEILLFNKSGDLEEQIDVSGLGMGSPRTLEYIPTTAEFAVRFLPWPQRIEILTRTGSQVRTVDLAPTTGIDVARSFAFVDPEHPSGGRFVVSSAGTRVVVTDLFGNALDEFDAREELKVLRLRDLTGITAGSYAGTLAGVDVDNSEVVIFELDE